MNRVMRYKASLGIKEYILYSLYTNFGQHIDY